MSVGLQDFKGFRGVAALCQIGDVSFMVIAKNQAQLEIIYGHVMPQADPINPDACQKCIAIQASLLPQPPEKK